jgi:hypothetical protein
MTATLLDCGHLPSPPDYAHTVTVGYGTDAAGRTFCYDCCTAQDIESLKDRSRPFVGYVKLSDNNKAMVRTSLPPHGIITNWSGRQLMTIVEARKVGHNLRACPSLLFVRARDSHGGTWSGRGSGDGMAIRLHPRKT